MFEIIPNWHPLFVHFTVALLTVSVILFSAAWMLKELPWATQWRHTAYWSLWIGVGLSVLTVLAGWEAYNTVNHDTPSHTAMTEHRNWALATFTVFILLALWSVAIYRKQLQFPFSFLVVAFLALGMLTSTGWRGGELVYRYGLGVMSLPKAEGDGHDHVHDGDDSQGQHNNNMNKNKQPVEIHDSDPSQNLHQHEQITPNSEQHQLDSQSKEEPQGERSDHHHDNGQEHDH